MYKRNNFTTMKSVFFWHILPSEKLMTKCLPIFCSGAETKTSTIHAQARRSIAADCPSR